MSPVSNMDLIKKLEKDEEIEKEVLEAMGGTQPEEMGRILWAALVHSP